MLKELKEILRFIDKHPLAGKHRVKAYSKFFSWQFSQAIFPHETTVPFVGNTKLNVKKGLSGATGNIYTGLHEFTDMAFLLHFLRTDDLFADIGANVGSYTVLAAGCKNARTLSFEPVPSTFHWLQKNIFVNSLHEKVKAWNIGIGCKQGKLQFTSSYDTVNHVATTSEASNKEDLIEVELQSFDAIAQLEGVPKLIKIDVEGFETEVIKGMNSTLMAEELKAIIIELNGSGMRYGYDEEWINNHLIEMGFSPFQYDPYSRSLVLLAHYNRHNTIYIRDLPFVQNRLKQADKIEIFSEHI